MTCWRKIFKRAIKCFFCSLLPIIDSEIMAHFWKIWHSTKFDCWWCLVTLIWTWAKYNSNTFKSTYWEQWNVFSHIFPSLLVFELGGVVILTPLPPTVAKVTETTTGVWLKLPVYDWNIHMHTKGMILEYIHGIKMSLGGLHRLNYGFHDISLYGNFLYNCFQSK